MILQEMFKEYGYFNIMKDAEGMQSGLFVNFFYDEEGKVPEELLGIYMSKRKDELFLVLAGDNYDIKKLCSEWDRKISAFMVWGAEDKKVLAKLKYNVIQLVIFQNEIKKRSEEGSLNISRKIFLSCTISQDGEINLDIGEEVEVPFFLISSDNLTINQNILDELEECISVGNLDLEFLENKRKKANKNSKSFLEKEYQLIEEWLRKDDNSED